MITQEPHNRDRYLGRTRAAFHLGLLVLLCALIPVITAIPALAHQDPPPRGQEDAERIIVIPLEDGRFDVGAVLGAVADEVGLRGDEIRRHVNMRVRLNGPSGRFWLGTVRRVTNGVMQYESGPDRLVIRIDEVKLRAEKQRLHRTVGSVVRFWFPEAAERAEATFDLFVHTSPDEMEPAVEVFARDKELASTRVVVLVHGLDDAGAIWRSTVPALIEQGFTVCRLEYPNDQPAADSAEFMAEHMSALHNVGVGEVSIVAHSMGGLITREVLTNSKYYGGQSRGQQRYPDVTRFIMVGTPNHGSKMARYRVASEIRDQVMRLWRGNGGLFNGLWDGAGEAKYDLYPDSEFLTALNSRPLPEGVEMTLIAGRVSPVAKEDVDQLTDRLSGVLPETGEESLETLGLVLRDLSSGVGDGCVPIRSVWLDGVDDRHVVEGNHLTMIRTYTRGSDRVPPAIPIILDRLDPQ